MTEEKTQVTIEENPRPSWDEYFMDVMHALSKRATCNRGKTACLLVKDNHIISSGYVGSPSGLPHCDEVGHLMKKVVNEDGSISEHCVRTIHAEQNAILFAAKNGISTVGSTLYVTVSPCVHCAKVIVAAGITRVFYKTLYDRSQDGLILLDKNGIECRQLTDEELA